MIPYDTNSSSRAYSDYYSRQVGGDLPFYAGARIQKGHGIGGVFSRLFKGAQPMITQALKVAGKELIKTGANIAKDALQGNDIKQSAKANFKRGGINLLSKLGNAFDRPKISVRKRKPSPRLPQKEVSRNKKRKRVLTKDIFS